MLRATCKSRGGLFVDQDGFTRCECGGNEFVEVGVCGDSGGVDLAADCITCGQPFTFDELIGTGKLYEGRSTEVIWLKTLANKNRSVLMMLPITRKPELLSSAELDIGQVRIALTTRVNRNEIDFGTEVHLLMLRANLALALEYKHMLVDLPDTSQLPYSPKPLYSDGTLSQNIDKANETLLRIAKYFKKQSPAWQRRFAAILKHEVN